MIRDTDKPRGHTLPRIAVVVGPTATIVNTPPLVTSSKARRKYGLDDFDEATGRLDAIRPQRLAAPVTVYIEQFSAHPLEMDASELYADPDGFIGADGTFSKAARGPEDVAVYEVELRPDDGLYLLPYMARKRDGSAWESGDKEVGASGEFRQTFYPDASRLFEEINRFEVDDEGCAGTLERLATYDFYRGAPSGGYIKGLDRLSRSDMGEADIAPEHVGVDFFPYSPRALRREPPRSELAAVTNLIQRLVRGDTYDGVVWLEGSPYVEETAYWLNLLIDSKVPIVCTAAANLNIGSRQNVVTAIQYICSHVWRDARGRDKIGVVGAFDSQIISARELTKRDARVGGFGAAGGHGGVVGSVSGGSARLLFQPSGLGTSRSKVKTTLMPATVLISKAEGGDRPQSARLVIRDQAGLRPDAIPDVHVLTHARYLQGADSDEDLDAAFVRSLWQAGGSAGRLVGLVAAGGTPYGDMSRPVEGAISEAMLCGIPVVKVGRGEPEGNVHSALTGLAIAGSNLPAVKARILLMACLMRFGPPPRVRDVAAPKRRELATIRSHLLRYQRVFDTH